MSVSGRKTLGTLVLLLGITACSTESVAPPVREEEISAIDPAVGAAAGQASLPGLVMDFSATTPGPAPDCAWDDAARRIVCAPVSRNGLTYSRSFAFYDANGDVQRRRDETTRAMNTQVDVTGTVVHAQGSVTVDRSSSLTVSGLGRASTTHTLNGSETGVMTGTRRTDRGTIASTETFTAETRDVVIPVPRTMGSWPLSGTTVRNATVTVTREGASESRTFTFSQVVTFNGTSRVPVTLSHNGVTRHCTLDLATRRTDCR